jgi:plastocyanin
MKSSHIHDHSRHAADAARRRAGGLFALILPLVLVVGATSASAVTVNVAVRDNTFNPKTITVNVGDTVVWQNTGAFEHTATSGAACAPDGTFDSGPLSPGESFSFTFNEPGSYPYYCIPHCAFGMTGSVMVTGNPTSTYLYVAAAANAKGSQNTDWRTDLMVLNGGSQAETVTLHYIAQGEDGTQNVLHDSFTLPAESAQMFPNVVETQFGLVNSAGNLHLHVRQGAEIFASARTYNQTPEGTYGQFTPGVSTAARVDTALLRIHERGFLAGLLHNEDYRTNLGFAETNGMETAVRVDFFDHLGAGIGSYALVLKPYSWQQLNLTDMGISDGYENEDIRAEVFVESGGGVVAYASVVDNRTGDAVYMSLVKEAFIVDRPHQLVAVVARAQGAYGTDWRTEAVFFNPFDTQTARLTLTTSAGSFDTDLEIPAGTVLRVPDLVSTLFPGLAGNLSGALHVLSARGLLILSRIYNQTDAGTYGQFVPAMTEEELLGPDDEGFVLQLASGPAYRSNFGLTEMRMIDTRVLIELYDAQGDPLAGRNLLVPAGQNVQITNLFPAGGGAQAVDAAWARVTVLSGGLVYAYGSVVDNRTGDANFSPAIRK